MMSKGPKALSKSAIFVPLCSDQGVPPPGSQLYKSNPMLPPSGHAKWSWTSACLKIAWVQRCHTEYHGKVIGQSRVGWFLPITCLEGSVPHCSLNLWCDWSIPDQHFYGRNLWDAKIIKQQSKIIDLGSATWSTWAWLSFAMLRSSSIIGLATVSWKAFGKVHPNNGFVLEFGTLQSHVLKKCETFIEASTGGQIPKYNDNELI